jgi:hypothetical protein
MIPVTTCTRIEKSNVVYMVIIHYPSTKLKRNHSHHHHNGVPYLLRDGHSSLPIEKLFAYHVWQVLSSSQTGRDSGVPLWRIYRKANTDSMSSLSYQRGHSSPSERSSGGIQAVDGAFTTWKWMGWIMVLGANDWSRHERMEKGFKICFHQSWTASAQTNLARQRSLKVS